jgi:hypothetical protein
MDRDAALVVLAALRSAAWFEQLYAVANLIRAGRQDDPEVERHLLQATIESGNATAAIGRLRPLSTRIEQMLENDDLDEGERDRLRSELGEIIGLLGRSYKQLYIDAKPTKEEPRTHDLDEAVAAYGRAFLHKFGDYQWHGINFVALRTHAERVATGDMSAVPEKANARRILDEILRRESVGALRSWDLATRAEALLAQGENRAAIAAIAAYLDAQDLTAFDIQSTHRQFVQLWDLEDSKPPGKQILPMLRARLAHLGGAPEAFDLTTDDSSTLEGIWGDTHYQPLRWLMDALQRARGIARLGPDQHVGTGTGFVIDGSWIGPTFADKPLLLTNAHVCSDDPMVQATFPHPAGPKELVALFLGAATDGPAPVIGIKERVVWTSPPNELDATLLELEGLPVDVDAPALASELPGNTGDEARVNIIGHPKSLGPQVSLQDNQVVSSNETFLHYRTPTDPGSSGSPVFNQSWELVALHHASAPQLKANEGVLMSRIVQQMRAELL